MKQLFSSKIGVMDENHPNLKGLFVLTFERQLTIYEGTYDELLHKYYEATADPKVQQVGFV